MSGYEEQALILRGMYLAYLHDLADALKTIADYKRLHGTWPDDAVETFDSIHRRGSVLRLAMKKLREDHERAEETLPTIFDGVVVPDFMPWIIT